MIKNAKRIFIWGTGNNANLMMNRINLYLQSGKNEVSSLWKERVIGFIDGDVSKQGGIFEGKPVVSLQNALDVNMDYCIITVADNTSIIERLICEGFRHDDYTGWKEFADYCRTEILSTEYECRRRIGNSDRLYKYLSYSRFFAQIEKGDLEGESSKLFSADNTIPAVASLEWYYGDEIEKATKTVERFISSNPYQGTIKTIGLLIERFFAGGIERTVSILSGLFSEQGYRVVLITDEDNADKDYPVQNAVVRYNMRSKHGVDLENRLLELKNVVDEYSIDILCYHGWYASLDTYYELLYFKLSGIPTTIEIHSAYRALVSDQPDSSKYFPTVYKMAGRVVTISNADNDYWQSKGCRCVMIPNPVGDVGTSKYTPRYSRKDRKRVLWIGRIVQNPKRVLDTVSIMRSIRDRDKGIKLVIVGARDNPKIYNELIEKINEFGLSDCISVLDFQKDVKRLYEEADALLMTSSSECYPNVIIEAKAFSRPIVMYEIPWLELTKDGKGVILVEQFNTEAVADELVKLLNDETLWNKLSEESFESYCSLKNYDPVRDWRLLFDSLLQEDC